MLRWAMAMLACCALLAPVLRPALAQPSPQAPPAQESQQDSRYVFHEVDEGILRFDTRLGEISLCSRQSMGWTCRMVPDERNALDAEITRLQQENAELRNALAALADRERPQAGPPRPQAAPAPEPPAKPRAPMLTLPDGADLERARAVVATIWKRLVEMMAHLREDLREKI